MPSLSTARGRINAFFENVYGVRGTAFIGWEAARNVFVVQKEDTVPAAEISVDKEQG